MPLSLSLIQTCCLISIVCSMWNLFGDLYYLDFYVTHLDMDNEFGSLISSSSSQSSSSSSSSSIASSENNNNRPNDGNDGYIFNFHQDDHQTNSNNFKHISKMVSIAQSGGYMYPIWAIVTILPLYVGLSGVSSTGRNATSGGSGATTSIYMNLVPCMMLGYGLCIMGGALHSSFAFLTAIPNVYFNYPNSSDDGDGNNNENGYDDEDIYILNVMQQQIVQRLFVGCVPGYIACNIAMIWIAYIVQFRRRRSIIHYYSTTNTTSTVAAAAAPTALTRKENRTDPLLTNDYSSTNTEIQFPKWFNIFNPLISMIWISVVANCLLPDYIVSFYITGCSGTWCIMLLNISSCYILWKDPITLYDIFSMIAIQFRTPPPTTSDEANNNSSSNNRNETNNNDYNDDDSNSGDGYTKMNSTSTSTRYGSLQ